MRYRLPSPDNWQDFERLCLQLWKELWSDPNAQLHGRSGQRQDGVDIYGSPLYVGGIAGVQCKDKDDRRDSDLAEDELLAECEKALGFKPTLKTFTVATTALSDNKIQSVARTLNSTLTRNGQRKYPFDVHVWSWTQIEAEVACRPDLRSAFYPDAPNHYDECTVIIAVTNPRDQFSAFFDRPYFRERLTPELRSNLIQLSYEVCDNAFSHGDATQVELNFDGAILSIKDNGLPFDPLTELDASKVSTSSHVGSFIVEAFLKKYGSDVELTYRREETRDQGQNALQVLLKIGAKSRPRSAVLDIMIEPSITFGRRGLFGIADTLVIPPGINEVVLTMPDVASMSAATGFIFSVRNRLPPGISLTVSFPKGSFLGDLAHVFKDPPVTFKSR